MTKLIIEIPDEQLADVAEIIRIKGGYILANQVDLTQIEQNGTIWNSLDQKHKQEVLLAYEESENEDNLVDAKAVFRNLK